jgi:hypothetical protein
MLRQENTISYKCIFKNDSSQTMLFFANKKHRNHTVQFDKHLFITKFFLPLSLSVNLKGYTELIGYDPIGRAKESFLEWHFYLAALLQGIKHLF